MTIRELSLWTGMDPSDVRKVIHRLRCKGYGIIGGNDGMSITTDFDLKVKQMEKMLANADKIREAAEGMLKGQHEELDDIEDQILHLLPEKKGIAPEQFRTEFEPIEVREDGTICFG